jgi:predicted ribosome quality control (RQC) complex YloA/Tae2 family protein
MKQGQLEIEPRESSRSPIQVSTQALLKAGLELKPRLDLSPRAEGVESDLRAEIERLEARELELLARELELVERASRAEGEAAALGALVPSLEQALKAVNTQLNTQRPVLDYLPAIQRVGLLERLRGRKRGFQGL